jgi:hypothetical protein
MKKGGRYSTMIVNSLNVTYNSGTITLSGSYFGGGTSKAARRRGGWFAYRLW